MLRRPVSILMYEGVYDFLTKSGEDSEHGGRQKVFDILYPIDPVQDVTPLYKVQPDLFERVERHVDVFGDGAMLAMILQNLEGEYLLDIRANIHESMFVITKLFVN